jgi:hypothetical protein
MTILYILLGIIALFIILALFAPKTYDVSRSIVVNRSLSDTFQYLKLIKNQDHWSPWKKRDPNMKQSQTGVDGTVGFINRWEGNKDVGKGEQELIAFEENKSIDSELRFLKPWKSVSIGYFWVKEVEKGKTEVTWGFRGTNKVPMNIMMLFYNMDKMVGKDFEEGLASLKAELEK